MHGAAGRVVAGTGEGWWAPRGWLLKGRDRVVEEECTVVGPWLREHSRRACTPCGVEVRNGARALGRALGTTSSRGLLQRPAWERATRRRGASVCRCPATSTARLLLAAATKAVGLEPELALQAGAGAAADAAAVELALRGSRGGGGRAGCKRVARR